MLEINVIKEKPQEIIQRLAIKNIDATATINKILELDAQRRETQKKLDDYLSELNQINKEIGILFKTGKTAQANELKEKTAQTKIQSKELDAFLASTISQMNDLLVQLPNTPHSSVPKGKTAEDNEVVYQEGNIPDLGKEALPHWDLATKYDIIDFELGVKITGAGFPVYKGKGARLQRALINFFLDNALQAGYREIQPPLMVNEDSGYGTGQLPDKEGQMYFAELDKLYLIPTAEVPVTNIYRNTILKASDFPVKNVAYSSCFRREAGSYGKDVRGLNRLHQFDKWKLFRFNILINHIKRSKKCANMLLRFCRNSNYHFVP